MSRICIPVPASTVIGVSSTPSTTPNSNIFRVDSTITALTGANSLAAISTSTGTYPVGICIFLPNLSVPATYQLVSGTDSHDPPFVVRPSDYAPTSNEKVWKQRM